METERGREGEVRKTEERWKVDRGRGKRKLHTTKTKKKRAKDRRLGREKGTVKMY